MSQSLSESMASNALGAAKAIRMSSFAADIRLVIDLDGNG